MSATPTSAGSGTQTAVINTEHTLLDSAAAGVFRLRVDKINLADGDVLELRIYEMVLTGGTRRVALKKTFSNAQPTDDEITDSITYETDLGDAGAVRATLKQTNGVGRTFPWKVLQY